MIASRKIPPPDASGEQHVTGKDARRGHKTHVPRGMAGQVQHGKLLIAQLEDIALLAVAVGAG